MNFFKSIKNLTKFEKITWLGSLSVIIISALAFPNQHWLSVLASLIGATALIFVAKGDPIGQLVTIIFAVFYGAVSLKFRYYGEMITYLCMSAPSAIWALVTWMRNPYAERQVKVASMNLKKWLLLILSSIGVTAVMGAVLAYFNTPNLIVSTLSVTTSFLASILTVMRSPYYALFYSFNDIVLIVLWTLATITDIGYLPMTLCFVIFLVNDIYGFVNWKRMKRDQRQEHN